jgi:transcriptional regulator with XRE-family HTH domain
MSRTVTPNGEKIKEVREAKGWSQERLARATRRSERTIQSIERGEACYRSTLNVIAEALGSSYLSLVLKADLTPIPKDQKRVIAIIAVKIDYSEFDETIDLAKLIEDISQRCGFKDAVEVIHVKKGSVIITLNLSESDFIRLLRRKQNSGGKSTTVDVLDLVEHITVSEELPKPIDDTPTDKPTGT